MFVGVALVGLTVAQVEGGVPGAMFVMAVSNLAAATCCAMDLFNGGYASQSQLLAKAQMKLYSPLRDQRLVYVNRCFISLATWRNNIG